MAIEPVTISRPAVDPARPAFVLVGGETLGHGALTTRSAQLANWLRSVGLCPGDHIAFMIENRAELLILAWAAQRCGLYYTPIPTHLKSEEAGYIIDDATARVMVGSARTAPVWRDLRARARGSILWASVDAVEAVEADVVNLDRAIAGQPVAPTAEEVEGMAMLYSSGTTGRPKGIKRPLSGRRFGDEPLPAVYETHHGMGADTVYLSPAPLYHAAPLRAVMAVQRLGGRVIALDRFDAEQLLAAIERHGVTHVQLVPTMLRRLLDLPAAVRARHDLSSLRCVIHAAAPCPVEVKRAAIDWLGPIVSEYYGGTEGVGMTYITSAEWLAHPGSVGKAILGTVHIIGEDGEERPPRVTGTVYFGGGPRFTYHNAPEKLAEVTDAAGRVTLGDIGWVDEAGYLTLVDRRSFVINAGGVNIYPVEIEEVLRAHADVADAAVIGVPDRDLGEVVKAVVEPRAPASDPQALAAALIAHCRARLSHVKCPRSIDIVDRLPRSDMGKLLKDEIKRRYWTGA
jgi:fatty-acyl-CoA synthase